MRVSLIGPVRSEGNPSEPGGFVKPATEDPEQPAIGRGHAPTHTERKKERATMTLSSKTWTTLGAFARVALAGGIVALAAGVLPGCIIAVGGTKHVVVSEPPVEQSKLDQIRLGSTTEEQARAILGAPTTRVLGDNDTTIWTYRVASSGSGKTVVYIDEDDDEIRTDRVSSGRVTIEFRNGVATAVRKE
jgi:outer membrane protein assembly factor BamE (lipoprotein component of BamABCDE complex)